MISCSELKKSNPYLFNSWRAILYTEKGKRAGVIDDWRKFSTFFEDVHNSYKEGLRLSRKDKDKPFGPDNFEWVTNLELAQTTNKLISVAGPELDYKSWYEQYRKLMEEQAQRKYGLYTPTSEGDDDDFPSIPGMIARYSASGLTNEQMKENPVWKDLTGNGHDLQMKNFAWKRMNIDETEVLLHIEHYDVLFPPMMTLEEDDNSDIVYPFPTYDATSTEFNSLITSDEWSTNTKDYDI